MIFPPPDYPARLSAWRRESQSAPFSVGAMPEPTPRVISWYGAKTGERSRPRNEPRKTRILSATAYRKCSSLSAIRLLGRILISIVFHLLAGVRPVESETNVLRLQNVPVTNLLEDAYTVTTPSRETRSIAIIFLRTVIS